MVGNRHTHLSRVMGLPQHADGAVAAPPPTMFERVMNLFRMKPATDALGKASSTTQAPTVSDPSPYTYNGLDYVKKAAEEAGKRNDAAQAQKASTNPPAKPLQQHAAGTVSAPGPPLGQYGMPQGQGTIPPTQMVATPPNPSPSAGSATPVPLPQPPVPQASGLPPGQPPMGQPPGSPQMQPGAPPLPGKPPVLNTGQPQPMAMGGVRRPVFGRYPRING